MRNRNLSSTSDTASASPLAARKSVGPSSPSSAHTPSGTTGRRSSRSPSNTVIAVVNAGAMAAGAASRESVSLDSGNQSPDTTTATTGQRLSSMTDSRSAEVDSLLADEEVLQAGAAAKAGRSPSSGGGSLEGSAGVAANTHIIRVSGPVTNLDETVLSANGVASVQTKSDDSKKSSPEVQRKQTTV